MSVNYSKPRAPPPPDPPITYGPAYFDLTVSYAHELKNPFASVSNVTELNMGMIIFLMWAQKLLKMPSMVVRYCEEEGWNITELGLSSGANVIKILQLITMVI